MATSTVPSYCRQREKKRTDRAYVRINGVKIKLGVYDSPESRTKYTEVLKGTTICGTLGAIDNPTVNEMLVGFLNYAADYYGVQVGGELPCYRSVAKLLRKNFGRLPAKDFGPRALKELREVMIAEGWIRKSINKQVRRCRAIFAWAVGEEVIPATNLAALQAVKGLRAGHTKAIEKPPIEPVPVDVIEDTLAELSPLVADMVRVHLLIGCRPSELLRIQPDLIDRSSSFWVYTPKTHKTAHLGKSRAIAIGPRAQVILQKYLFGEWCFQTPQGNPYRIDSYRNAILRAARRAGVDDWTPNRLRHNAATTIRAEFGLEAAQVVLGHSKAAITEVYAERDLSKAGEVAMRIG